MRQISVIIFSTQLGFIHLENKEKGAPLWNIGSVLVDKNETPHDAAARYANEKTGSRVSVNSVYFIDDYAKSNLYAVVVPFPADEEDPMAGPNHLKGGWRFAETVAAEAWTMPSQFTPDIVPAMFAAREVLKDSVPLYAPIA